MATRILFRHAVAERLRHVPDGRAADGDGRDGEAGLPERLAGEGIGGGRGHVELLQYEQTSTGGCYPSALNAATADEDHYTSVTAFAGVVKWQTRQP